MWESKFYGAFVPNHRVVLHADYLKWGYYVAFHSYTFRIFMHNEFNPINNLDCKPFCDGEEVLRFYDMGDVDVAADFGVLIGFAVFFQLCFAVVLYYFHTGRR